MEFYKTVGKNLFIFNLASIFFLLLTIFGYSLIQFMAGTLYDLVFILFSDSANQQTLISILNFFLVIPLFLDYAFLFFVIVFSVNIMVLAWKTRTGSLFTTMLFSLIGLPLWVYFMDVVNDFKLWALRFLSSVLSNNINTPFYNYIQTNSLEFSITLFIIVIAIRTIDWENLKVFNKFGKKINPISSGDERTLQEIIKQ